MKDSRISRKLGVVIRRISLRDGTDWSIRPSFVMPYMAARTQDVQDVLFLRKFPCPSGRWPRSMVAIRCSTIVCRVRWDAARWRAPPSVGEHCRRICWPMNTTRNVTERKRTSPRRWARARWLGAEIAESAGTDDLTAAYRVFRDEALNIDPEYKPDSVNTDGWGPTQTAWGVLFSGVTVLVCFLPAWLKIRCRGKKHDLFSEVSRRV